MAESQAEMRKFPRHEVHIEAELNRPAAKGGTDTTQAVILNISEGGIFIETDEPVELNEEITCRFAYPQDNEKCEFTGKILWRRLIPPKGIGIQMTSRRNLT